MSESIIVAVITGLVSLLGTVITVVATSKKTTFDMRVAQAVTDTKIQELTREVRAHNNFAQRLPVVEEQIKNLNEKLKELEDDHK